MKTTAHQSCWRIAFLAMGWALGTSTLEAETYHRIAVRDLNFENGQENLEGVLSQPIAGGVNRADVGTLRFPSESYFARVRDNNEPLLRNFQREGVGGYEVVFRVEGTGQLQGVLDLRPEWDGEVKSLAFTLDPATAKGCSREEFEEIRKAHYLRLLQDPRLPGAAWFKHHAKSGNPNNRFARRRNDLDQTFSMFTGGRAIAENLALDRELLVSAGPDAERVALTEIKGVTVKAINWKNRLPEGEVAVDPLSLKIPLDQHALFFPSLPQFLNLLKLVEQEGAPLLQVFSAQSPYRILPSRYRAQLGMDLPDAAARLLPVKSVAVTGGDPFFPLGTDVALLFETTKPMRLYRNLLTAIELKAANRGAVATSWKREGLQYRGFETPDRSFSSHLLQRGDLVVVSNSLTQLKRLLQVGGNLPALGESEEYRFFRDRYQLAGDESAFVFLSDATLRRWSGPEVRIGASRRTRALAALTELSARVIEGVPVGNEFEGLLGKLQREDRIVISARHGSVKFMTPVSELGIVSASKAEKEAYDRWRTGYERGWAQVFDPIALRIGVTKETRALDLTVLPLRVGSDYEDIVEMVGNATLSPMARMVPAKSLLHLAFAVDRKSDLFSNFDQELPGMLPGLKVNPLGWVGESVSITLEDGFFWKALPEVEGEIEMLLHMPIVLRVESTSRLKLAAFLIGLRAVIESSSPDLVSWQTKKHGKKSYVVVSGEEDEVMDFAIYYAALPKALLISLDEDVLKRAIDRELAGPDDAVAVPLEEARQVLFESGPDFLMNYGPLLDSLGIDELRRRESWRALPILNEWHQLFKDSDPVAIHREAFGVDLFCPGGRGYRWNEKALTMESVAFGHPAAPRNDATALPLLGQFDSLRAGFEFSEGGLRARVLAGPKVDRAEANADQNLSGAQLATAEELTLQTVGVVKIFNVHGTDGEATETMRILKVEQGNGGVTIVTESVQELGGDKERDVRHERLENGLHTLRLTGATSAPSPRPARKDPLPPKSAALVLERFPIAVPIPDRPGFFFNPFTNSPVDGRAIPPGTLIRDPNDPDPDHKFRLQSGREANPKRRKTPATPPAPRTPSPPLDSEKTDDEEPASEDHWQIVYEVPMIYLPAKLIAGMRKTYSFSGTSSSQVGKDTEEEQEFGEVDLKVIGLETVTVPAGIFEDCVRIETGWKSVTGSLYATGKDVAWYAKGVGAVKIESRQGGWRRVSELTKITK